MKERKIFVHFYYPGDMYALSSICEERTKEE